MGDETETDDEQSPQLEPVTCHLQVRGGPNPDWQVRWFHLAEAISEPHELSLDVSTTELDVETDDLLGADVELQFGRGEFERQLHGVIERVDLLGVERNRLGVRLRVVPALQLLTHHVDARVFQDKKVPEILRDILTEALGQYGRKVDVSRLADAYLDRDYCVQYGESTFDFTNRLMQEEGISYFFEPEIEGGQPTGVELLVLVDQAAAQPNAGFPKIDGEGAGPLPIVAGTHAGEALRYLDWSRPQMATKVSLQRFNWKRPDPQNSPAAVHEQPDARGRVREVYLPDDRRRIEDRGDDEGYSGTAAEHDEGPLVRRRFEASAGERATGRGASNVTSLRAAGLFAVGDHVHPELAFSRLLTTRIVHYGDVHDDTGQGESRPSLVRYHNTFECISARRPFRPAETTPKPRVFGPQTAIVTGPANEEIHTDRYGRIKIQFHWDRVSARDGSSSCWVRVAQMWAGRGWGSWFLPRIGMEVVVDFLEGNPDRPLVVGCVYNGHCETPYDLPEQKTKSTIKSNSSLGGGGFNELRFEDAKGAEEVFLHAQKDYNQIVLSNRSRQVGGNEHVSISGNQELMISGAPVHGRAEAARQGRTTQIDGHEYLEVTNTVHIKAPQRIVLEVPGSSIVIEPSGIMLVAGDGASISMDADVLAASQSGSTLELAGGVVVDTDTSVEVNGGTVDITGESEVTVNGGVVRLN